MIYTTLTHVEKIDNIPEENTAMTKPETPSSFSNEGKKMSDIPCPMSPSNAVCLADKQRIQFCSLWFDPIGALTHDLHYVYSCN
jgi:hypothetical protein